MGRREDPQTPQQLLSPQPAESVSLPGGAEPEEFAVRVGQGGRQEFQVQEKKCTLAYVTYFNPNEFFKILRRRRLDSLD